MISDLNFYNDEVCLVPNILCGTAPVAAAGKMSDRPFHQLPYDGILGLGPESTLMRAFAQQGLLKENRFALSFGDEENQGGGSGGADEGGSATYAVTKSSNSVDEKGGLHDSCESSKIQKNPP